MDMISALPALNTEERAIFGRLLDMGEPPVVAKETVAVCLWRESWGHYQFMENIQSQPDAIFYIISKETRLCYKSLQNYMFMAAENHPRYRYLRLITQRERAARGVADLFNGVVKLICEDIIEKIMFEASSMRVAAGLSGHGGGETHLE